MLVPLSILIVDTDAVSFIFKGDTRGAAYDAHLASKLAYISFQTAAELQQWAIARNWGAQRRAELSAFLSQRFAVIESSPQLCRQWAEVREQVRNAGYIIQPADAWIAATATLYGVPLLTNNANDFAHIAGLTVITVR
ncbi:MAG: PIN domain-containing protein [Blastocatellia bacterium]